MVKLLRRRGLRAVRIAGADASQAGAIPVQASRRAVSALNMFARTCSILAVSFTCAACATTQEPTIRTVEVKVPVAVACATQPPAKPTFADTPSAIRGAADLAERVKLLLAGREQRDGYIVGLEAANAGCR